MSNVSQPVGLSLLLLLAACGHAQESQEPPPPDPISEVEPEELMRQGVGLARSGDLVRAEQYIVAAMGRGYEASEAMPVLLRVCVAASRLRAALAYAEPYLQQNPRDWSLRFLVASIHQGLGEVPNARRELETVIQAAPEVAEPHYALAVLLRDDVGDVENSDAHFRRYLELDPAGRYAEEVTHSLRRIAVPQPIPEADNATDGESETNESDDDEPQDEQDAEPTTRKPSW